MASSADGAKLVAVYQVDGKVYTSADSGVGWTERDPTGGGAAEWNSVASSADGAKLVACELFGGKVYTSADSGASWTESDPAGGDYEWWSVASSADGMRLVACGFFGKVYTSADSGVTWTESAPLSGDHYWAGTVSSDGTRVVVCDNGGRIYTGVWPSVSTVTTTAASSITSAAANSGGNVTFDGAASVTARGVCWSTSANPTIADSKTNDGTGTGVFASSITGLNPSTIYHVRAYATNSEGTAYGQDLSLSTAMTTPTVMTATATNISESGADSGGTVTSDGGAAVTARGVCWSTAANPTIADSKTDDGTGTGAFASTIAVLSGDTVYHVRAYATNNEGTAYGDDLTFSTTAASGNDPAPDPDPDATVEATADPTGTATAGNDAVDVIVEGIDEGTTVVLDTDETGQSTLTIGDPLDPDLTLVVDGVAEGTDITVSIDENGDPSITLSNPDGSRALDLTASGFGVGSEIALAIDEAGNQMIVITAAAGFMTTLDLNFLPQDAVVSVSNDAEGNVSVAVVDEAGQAPDVSIVAGGVAGDVVFTVTYNDPPLDAAAAKIISGMPGFEDGKSLGGSVTIAASGLADGSVVVALTYNDADLAGIDEADLRLLRFDESSSNYEAAGTRDAGDQPPTGMAGDWGYDSEKNSAWAVVSELGTFAVGVPESANALPEDDTFDTGLAEDDPEAIPDLPLCGAGAAPCGALGMTQWLLTVAGLTAMRRRYR